MDVKKLKKDRNCPMYPIYPNYGMPINNMNPIMNGPVNGMPLNTGYIPNTDINNQDSEIQAIKNQLNNLERRVNNLENNLNTSGFKNNFDSNYQVL